MGWKGSHTLVLAAICAAIVALGVLAPVGARASVWITTVILLTVFVSVVGRGLTGLWRGALIDERNMISLSRLQLVVWTMLILPAFLQAALHNISLGGRGTPPLSIELQPELWLLMGISTASLLGSPLLRAPKTQQRPSPTEMNEAFSQLEARHGTSPSALDTHGLVLVNRDASMSRWSDLFRGEEVGNAAMVDLGKVQMFFFSLIAALAYAVELWSMFSTGARISALPAMPAGMVALIGISHTGYLANKAMPHSGTP